MKRLAARSRRAAAPRAGRGMTLLELILSMLLASTLMAGLWSLMSMQLRLYERGGPQLERMQLGETLLELIADDLQSVAMVSTPPDKSVSIAALIATQAQGAAPTTDGGKSSAASGATSSPAANSESAGAPQAAAPAGQGSPSAAGPTRRSAAAPRLDPPQSATRGESPRAGASSSFPATDVQLTQGVEPSGLFGTAQGLVLDVLQEPDPLQRREKSDTLFDQERSDRPSRAGELHTVTYQFNPPGRPTRADDSPPGLARRELSWESTRGLRRGGIGRRAAGRSLSTPEATAKDPTELLHSASTRGRNDSLSDEALASATVAEVTAIRFRYFDGSRWTQSWDSRARKSLPAAVEIVIAIGEPGVDADPSGATSDEAFAQEDDPDQTLSRDLELDRDEGSNGASRPAEWALQGDRFRRVVYLPGTRLEGKPGRTNRRILSDFGEERTSGATEALP